MMNYSGFLPNIDSNCKLSESPQCESCNTIRFSLRKISHNFAVSMNDELHLVDSEDQDLLESLELIDNALCLLSVFRDVTFFELTCDGFSIPSDCGRQFIYFFFPKRALSLEFLFICIHLCMEGAVKSISFLIAFITLSFFCLDLG